ncbi:MAG: T9SS type A sorting domain-containing protein [Ginsengibacter sp.]
MKAISMRGDIYSYIFKWNVWITASFVFLFNFSYGQADVLMNHNDLKRTGWNNKETILATDNVSSGNFGKIFSRDVDDQIYAQPLVVSNVSIGGGTHNIVLVATVNNTLYAFDADDPNASSPYWKVNLTFDPANYRPVQNTDMTGACTSFPGGYQDFRGKIGIVGTPAIDTSTKTIYLVARSVSKTGNNYLQYLHAIDYTTGNDKLPPKLITATYPGTGYGSTGGVITFDPQKENQRPGLLLLNKLVYIAWSSHCDWGPYQGWLMAYDASTLDQKYVYNTAPNSGDESTDPQGGQAGIWMSGLPPSVDEDGNLYITTGNGLVGQNNNPNDTTNRGNSLIKLSPDLKVLDFFTPMNYQFLNDDDEDYGSDGALLLPNTNFSISGSKEGKLYLIDNNNMGGTTGDNSNVLQTLQLASTETPDVKNVHGTPVYFKDEYNNEYIYGWAEESLLHQYPFDRNTMRFDTLNEKIGYTTLPAGMPGGMLAVSSNGSQHGTGILWASHPINGDAEHDTVPGILQAFDATDVTNELWNSNWNSKRDSIGRFAKFVPPTIANGKVYMATFSRRLNVYGLNPPSASPCSNSLPPIWQSADIGYLHFPGDVCVNNGVYTITTSGDDVWGIKDAFHYVFQKVITNETELTIRVDSFFNNTQDSKCGIMFRQNLDPGSPNVFLSLTPQGVIYSHGRTAQNGSSMSFAKFLYHPAPCWLRIYNKGNQYVSSYSENGTDWTIMDTVTLALGPNSFVGLAFSRNDNTGTDTVNVSHVSLKVSGALDVNLINFNAKNQGNKSTLLLWTTTNETNINHFEIQRSSSNSDFVTIGSVEANGITAKSNNYTFRDKEPLDGNNYYRLKLIGDEGEFTYSSTALVRFNFKTISIYPNPVKDRIFIANNENFSNKKNIIAELLDYSGKILSKQVFKAEDNNNLTFYIPNRVANGMYLLVLTNVDGVKQVKKVFINR